MKVKLNVLLGSFFLFSLVPLVHSQDMNEAIAAYNKGLNARQADNFDSALVYFDQAVNIAKALGEEGEEVVMNVQTQLPALYYQRATELYKQQKVDEAIQNYSTAAELAGNLNDTETAERATSAMSDMYYFKGVTDFKAKKFEEARNNFNKAIEVFEQNTKAYYMLAATYKSLDDDEQFYSTAKKGMEVSKAANDNKYYDNIAKLAGDHFLLKANSSKKAEKYSEAEKFLKNSLEFDNDDPNAYFLLTQVYNAEKKYNEAIETANKALQYEKDTPEDKAKVYYEMASAYKAKGETSNACDAYKKAAVGPFKESAEYYMKNDLKCE